MTFSEYLHQFQQFKPFKIDFFLIEHLKAYGAQRYHSRHTNIQILILLSSKCEDCQSLTFMLIVWLLYSNIILLKKKKEEEEKRNPYEEQHENKTKYTEFVNALC